MQTSNLKNIEVARNIAIILVVLGHAGCIYAGKWSYELVNTNSISIAYFTEYIYSFHMPLYVFISGYIYNYMRINLNKYNDIKNFIINKFKRLILPYLATGILFMISLQTVFRVYSDDNSIIYRIINGIILSKKPAHLWYLVMIFNLFIIFRFAESRIRDNNKCINLFIFISLNIISIVIPNIYQLSSALQYLIYFYIGYMINENTKKIKNIKLIYVFLIHLIFFNIFYYIDSSLDSNLYIKLIMKVLKIALSTFGIIYIYVLSTTLLDNKITKYFIENSIIYNVINKYNFYIYLLHQPIMLSIIANLKNINIQPITMYIIILTLTIIFTLISAIVIDKVKHRVLLTSTNS